MLRLFIEKDFESKERKIESIKIMKILTKDGIYCSYLKWICSGKLSIFLYIVGLQSFIYFSYIYIYILDIEHPAYYTALGSTQTHKMI